MYSLKLWHFGMTAAVVVVIVALSIKHMFSDDTQWEQASARGLQQKISMGLEQIYWQWQNEGRPVEIMYRPQNAKASVKIQMRDDGKPQFEVNNETCTDFLNWFVQDVSLKQFVEVSIENPENIQPLSQSAEKLTRECNYTMANHTFAYNVHDAQIHN